MPPRVYFALTDLRAAGHTSGMPAYRVVQIRSNDGAASAQLRTVGRACKPRCLSVHLETLWFGGSGLGPKDLHF